MSLKNIVKWNKPDKRVHSVWFSLCEILHRQNHSAIAIRTVVALGWVDSKGTQQKCPGWWKCFVHQLGWGSHEWMHLSKHIKLDSKNLHFVICELHLNKMCIEKEKIPFNTSPPRLPLPEETTLNRLYALLDQLCPHRCSQRNIVVVILLGRSVYVNGSILWVSSAPCFGERVLTVLVELPRSFNSCGAGGSSTE